MNVYVVIPTAVVLITAGFHVPVMPLLDVPDKDAGVLPIQYGPSCVNVGVTLLDTSILIVAVVAHWPALGVKVYTVVPTLDVLIVLGFHVPVMAGVLVELVGRAPGVALRQYGPNCANVGVTGIVTTMVIVVGVPH